MKDLDSNGQALIESLFAIPLAILVVSSIFMGFLYLSSEFLTDHWTYQGALCIASQKPIPFCKGELESRLNLLPFYQHKILGMERRSTSALIKVSLTGPLMKRKVFSESLRLPLRPHDFGNAL